MSWRFLFVFLLLTALAAWQGGIQLGEWLIARAPDSIASTSRPKESNELILDANGKPFTAQPPQPRVDGTLGPVRERTEIDWALDARVADPFSAESTEMKIDADGMPIEASEGNYEKRDNELFPGGSSLPSGQRDIATLDVANTKQDTNQAGRQQANAGSGSENSSIQQAAPTRPAPQTWQQALKNDLNQCASLGFFQRPTCVQNARNRYCAPNNAWGKTADCPARSSDPAIGG